MHEQDMHEKDIHEKDIHEPNRVIRLIREDSPLPLRALLRRVLEILSLREARVDICFDPTDRAVLEELAERSFELHNKEEPLGTIGRGRLILRIIEESFPTEHLSAEYFRNLDHLLSKKKRREVPGQVLVGVGTGRSGSTSLAALLATADGCCCTHENPPLIFWTPEQEQLQFHMNRFRFLAEYFSLVADVSHWWLNAIDIFLKHFPSGKIVGTIRDADQCASSFMQTRGYGWGSWNHWVPYGNGIWNSNLWDPTYPTYSLPSYSSINPDRAKYNLIMRYVQEYTEQLIVIAATMPERVMLVKTQDLGGPSIQKRIFDFAGVEGSVSNVRLNIGSVVDAQKTDFRF